MEYNILVAEDDFIQRKFITKIISSGMNAKFIEAGDGAEALSHLNNPQAKIDLALVDLSMPILGGMELIKQGHELRPKLPFIVLTASESIDDAVEAINVGAKDFITKPAEPERLITSIKNILDLARLQNEVTSLRNEKEGQYSFDKIVEFSPSLGFLVDLGRKAAKSDIPVLITGESGVGKEVFAHAIHQESKRAGKPFISVNCGAIPDNLVESTLFGHEKGSFTGATSKSIGKCREAEGGVLFLDEVGELKLETQVKLLRLLQEGEIAPVGASKPVKVDVRVISATNRSLESLINEGKFREDLYYRLHGLPLHIPALRDRKKDIAILAESLLARIARTENRHDVSLSPEAIDWLKNKEWPGNIRELQHLLSRTVILTESNLIKPADFFSFGVEKKQVATSARPLNSISVETEDGRIKTLEEIDREVINAVLQKFDSHVGKAAAALGIGQSTLYKYIRKN